MAHRLYIYTDNDTLVEANYELPLFFFPLFISKPKIKQNCIYALTTEGVAFFEQFYNFIQSHADKLITDLNLWQKIRPKMSAELARIAQETWLMLEMSDVFNMSDKPHKVQAKEQLELLQYYNSIIQDAIEADNPALLNLIVDYSNTADDFKSYLNYEHSSYGWAFFEAQSSEEDESRFPIEFEENGKFGLKNTSGNIIAPAKYDNLYAFEEHTELCVAEVDGQSCYLTTQGEVEFGQMFDDCFDFFNLYEPEKQIAIAKTNGQYGLINRKGEWVAPPAWDDMHNLYHHGELIAYKKGELWGVMDGAGKIIQAPQYPYKPLPNYNYGTSYYTCSPDEGEPVLFLSLNWKPFEFKKYTAIGALDGSNHLRTALGKGKNARYGLINKDAETVLECIYTDLEYDDDLLIYRIKRDKKWGIFHPTNGWILPCEYDKLTSVLSILFSNTTDAQRPLLIVQKRPLYGVFDSSKQTWILPCTFGEIDVYDKNVFGVKHVEPREEAGFWVHDGNTGQPLAGPYHSLVNIESSAEFSGVIVFTRQQVFTVEQSGLVKPLTEAQADSLAEIVQSNYMFNKAQAVLIKNAFSKIKRAEEIKAEGDILAQQGQYQRAYDLYVRAGQVGDSNGYVHAGYLVGTRPELENPPLARHYYELAAQANNSMGIWNLANYYQHGIGGEQNMQKALQLYHESEEKDCLRAASNLADIYYHDEQLKDHAQALKYYLKAYCDSPYPLEIGYLYETLLKDYSSAYKYFQISGKQGQGYAYNRIGIMWELGLLGKINLTKAQDYYQKAISAEYSEAYAGLNLAKLLINTNSTAAKAAWQFALDHEDIVEGLLEFGQEQGWA